MAAVGGLICCVAVFGAAYAGEGQSSLPADPPGEHHSVLDGLVFEGKIGPKGGPAFSDDVWVFENGMFASMECRQCGFPKGEYWVRFEDGGIRFRTDTICPETGAKLVYTGMVKDQRIEGTYTWTKERWYWDIEKEFWFEGKLSESGDLAGAEPRPE
jgi:hypothetical protein